MEQDKRSTVSEKRPFSPAFKIFRLVSNWRRTSILFGAVGGSPQGCPIRRFLCRRVPDSFVQTRGSLDVKKMHLAVSLPASYSPFGPGVESFESHSFARALSTHSFSAVLLSLSLAVESWGTKLSRSISLETPVFHVTILSIYLLTRKK